MIMEESRSRPKARNRQSMIGKKHKEHTGVPQARKKRKEKDLVPGSERKLKGSSRERRTIVSVVDGGGMKLRL